MAFHRILIWFFYIFLWTSSGLWKVGILAQKKRGDKCRPCKPIRVRILFVFLRALKQTENLSKHKRLKAIKIIQKNVFHKYYPVSVIIAFEIESYYIPKSRGVNLNIYQSFRLKTIYLCIILKFFPDEEEPAQRRYILRIILWSFLDIIYKNGLIQSFSTLRIRPFSY